MVEHVLGRTNVHGDRPKSERDGWPGCGLGARNRVGTLEVVVAARSNSLVDGVRNSLGSKEETGASISDGRIRRYFDGLAIDNERASAWIELVVSFGRQRDCGTSKIT